MRKKIVAGNWKMNTTFEEATALATEICAKPNVLNLNVEVIIAPPSLYLSVLQHNVGLTVPISAQNVSAHAEFGAYTGEFSAAMLHSIGVKYAIVGHSERRSYHGEKDQEIAKKIKACLQAGIIPIYCCGENLEEREAGRQKEVVSSQIRTALNDFESHELQDLILAYEPVWAIGTGKTASAEQAQEMHSDIRELISETKGESLAQTIRILYGGSCKPSNAESLFSQPDVDGGLIGGASLNADDFMAIVRAAAK